MLRKPYPNYAITRRILNYLKNQALGGTLREISRGAECSVPTARKHLERLRDSQEVQEFVKAPMRLFILKEKLATTK